MASHKTTTEFPYKALLFFIALNLLVLDGFVLWSLVRKGTVLGETTASTCPQACINRINAVAGKSTVSSVKEYYIPLGTGTSTANEWTTVQGTGAYIDATAYGKLKKITLEVTTSQPNSSQRIWIRLLNATEGRVIANSEITSEASGPINLTSGGISLDYGNKLYQIQMKTQLGGLTNLTQSRIHILTN